MNKRDYKIFSADSISHVYNRGNNKENIFFDEQDYRAFLFRLGLCLGFTEKELTEEKLLSFPYSRIRISNAGKNNFKLHAFCLMPNHFHLLIEQVKDIPISNLIAKLCTSYSKYINNKYKRIGHVFQDKFKTTIVENNPQLMWTSAYIHCNPVKDNLVKHPRDYKWSSFNDFLGTRKLPIVSLELIKSIFEGNFEKETMYLGNKEHVKDGL